MSALLLDFAVDPEVAARLGGQIPEGALRLRLDDLRGLGTWGSLKRLVGRRYDRCTVIVNDHRAQGRWIPILALALLARARRRVLIDPAGEERPLSWGSFFARELPFAIRRARLSSATRGKVSAAVAKLKPAGASSPHRPRHVAFVRADIGPPLTAGGSLAHIRGVIESLHRNGIEVSLFSPAPVLGVEPALRSLELVAVDPEFNLSTELPPLAYNFRLYDPLVQFLRSEGVDLVYCRHALGGYAAAAAAADCGLPLVVEFNGSEVWIARRWGDGLKNGALFEEIERKVLQAADLVVAVSEPLRAQLHEAGVADSRILVNPNGVDIERFDASAASRPRDEVRRTLGVGKEEILAGFVGTFGPWHGAEVLAEAAGRLDPAVASRLRLLFVGDGARRRATEEILERSGMLERAYFPGLVPQDETPALLAACDLCISPHVPNPDGTPFFGSPTKLFEYMVSGAAIVASRLDQIGDLLADERTALLVRPGDATELARAIERLVAEPALRERLRRAAREEASGKHTWHAHVARILDRLADPATVSAQTQTPSAAAS